MSYEKVISQLREAAVMIEGLVHELQRARKENDFLRAFTSQTDKACVYCGLGADEQSQCRSGFPGCARADDQMLCREVGVALERDDLRKQVESLRKELELIRSLAR